MALDPAVLKARIDLRSVRKPKAQNRLQAALKRGFQTRDAEMDLARFIGELSN